MWPTKTGVARAGIDRMPVAAARTIRVRIRALQEAGTQPQGATYGNRIAVQENRGPDRIFFATRRSVSDREARCDGLRADARANLLTVLDGKCLEFDIGPQAMNAALASEARFLVAAKGAGRVELVVRVAPDHAGLELAGDVEDLGALVRPDARGQAVGRVIGAADGFFGGTEGQDREHRAEDLFAGDHVAGLHAAEEARAAPVALFRQRRTVDLVQLGALFGAGLEEVVDAVKLGLAVDGADVGVLVERIAYA